MQEIEIVDGQGIFNAKDEDLKYDMIDVTRANNIVNALDYVKKQMAVMNEDLNSEVASAGDGISVIDGGRISANVTTIQGTLEKVERQRSPIVTQEVHTKTR